MEFNFDDDLFEEPTKYIPDITKKTFVEIMKEDREKGIKEINKYFKKIKNIEEQKMIDYYNNKTSLLMTTYKSGDYFNYLDWLTKQEFNEYNERYFMSKEDKK